MWPGLDFSVWKLQVKFSLSEFEASEAVGPQILAMQLMYRNEIFDLHPRKLTWNPKTEGLWMFFLFQGAVFRFHVSFLGCTSNYINFRVFSTIQTGYIVGFCP